MSEEIKYKERKMIIVDGCDTCPYEGKCSRWKALSNQQKMILIFGDGRKKFILNGCPLPYGEDGAEATNLAV